MKISIIKTKKYKNKKSEDVVPQPLDTNTTLIPEVNLIIISFFKQYFK